VRENRISRECFDAEHALLASRGGIDKQLDLRLHRVDDHFTRLQAEKFVQSLGDTEILNEASELREATVASQTWVRLSKVNLAWVRAMDAASATIPVSALATKRISSHLLGAWRGLKRLHRNEHRCSRQALFSSALCIV
jgi:hypothetical protein